MSESTFDPVADFKSLWAGKPGITGPAVIRDTAEATASTKSQAETILNSGGLLILICVVLVLLAVVTFVSTGSFLATLVVIAILIGVILLLGKLGILKIYFSDGMLQPVQADHSSQNHPIKTQHALRHRPFFS